MSRFYCFFALCLTAFSLTAILVRSAAAEDELFTRIPIDSVFKKSTEPPTNARGNDSAEKSIRVLNITQLNDLLKEAGLEPEVSESAVTVKMQQSKWTFTTVLGLDENRQQIVILMRLIDLEGKAPLSADRLLTLMMVNRDLRPAMFSYSDKNKRIELLMGLDNDQISGRSLRDELRRLAGVAESSAPLWEVEAVAQTPSPAAAPAAPPAAQNVNRPAAPNSAVGTQPAQRPVAAATPAPAATSGVVGRWSAARSAKEAFAMLLNADNTFVLVYVKDGKQSKSTGKFTLTGSQLSLSTTDGGKFGGTVSNLSAKSFDFTPPTGATGKLTFQKAS